MEKIESLIDQEYEVALKELRKLNDDLFYRDFKETVEELKNHSETELSNHALIVRKNVDQMMERANGLLRELENQKRVIHNLLNNHVQENSKINKEFLEYERTQLLFVYDELQKKLAHFERESKKNKEVFADTNKKNSELMSGQYSQIEDLVVKETNFIKNLAQLINSEILASKEEVIQEAKVQYSGIIEKQSEILNISKIESDIINEKNADERKQQHIQLIELINTTRSDSVSKKELAIFEKRQNRKQWFLISIVSIEAVFIGAIVYLI